MKRPSVAAVIAPGGGYTGLVWPLSLAQLISWGSIYYSFTLFVAPMEAELGLERTELTGALTLGLLVSGACSLPVGALIDKGYARALMSAASVLAGVLLLAWSEVQTGTQFFVIWAGLGAVLAATLYEPAFAVLVRSLGSLGKRGIASMTLVGGLASTVFIPLTHVLIEDLGWRDALQVLALFNFAVCAPIHVIVLRRARPVRETGDRGATAPAMKRAMERPALWWLALAFTASIFSVSALTFHVVPMLSERGYALGAIVSAFALFGPSQVATRILVTVIAPGVDLLVTGCLAFGLPILALIVVLLGPESFGTIALFAICLGSGNGIVTIVRAVAVAELFGEAGFGTINGIIAVPVNAARALAPATAAALWAATGGYGPVLWALSVVSLVSLLAYVVGVRAGRRAEKTETGAPAMVISGQRTDVPEGTDAMNSEINRERLEPIREALRGCLEAARAPIIEEIRTYPRQIAGCDVQFQDLVEKRNGISGEMNRLEALFRDDIPGIDFANAIELFMELSAYIDDQTAGKIRADLKSAFAALNRA